MGLFDFLSKQFIDVIDWGEAPDDLALRYPMRDHAIQNGASLTVRDGQIAFFYEEGRIADAFEPGRHTLETDNLPVLTALMNWDKGFVSPFKADLYFFTVREHAGLKWGTAQPITVRDKDYGPIRVRTFGSYSFRIADVPRFKATVMGTLEHVRVGDLEPQLRGAIATAIASELGRSEIAFVDLAGDQQALSDRLRLAVAPAFAQWGLEMASFFVESVSLPDEVQAHFDKASAMRVIGNLDDYVRFQAADAIDTAAGQHGGMASLGAGAAAGAALGQAMASGLASGTSAAPSPPAPAPPAEDPFALIEKLHKLHVAGALSQEEFEAKKAALLAKIG
ncbi:SPFH domain-containing protein [Sphingomonas sanguinis]|uniref:SPFH domain-containing protein n=1 Tax=Sphingomonas sanguinis TaxID=33051 RepID=A0ABU5LQD9_9SPHN|nr:SPFH domain-containing protein [Sphingomonas sanguinis]MDZ7282159.1 SPFH domain-containing protein [Sphingomonas sanguinis]